MFCLAWCFCLVGDFALYWLYLFTLLAVVFVGVDLAQTDFGVLFVISLVFVDYFDSLVLLLVAYCFALLVDFAFWWFWFAWLIVLCLVVGVDCCVLL